MDTNAEMAPMDMDLWVNARMSCLVPASEWRPNLASALARFDERRGAKRTGKGAWALAFAVAVCLCILAFPASREAIRRASTNSYLRAVNVGQVSANSVTLKYRQAAPDFTLPGATGDNIRLSAYKGQVVLLNFWATWCHGCQTEIPWLVEFQDKYRTKGFAVIGVSMDDDGWKAVKPFAAAKRLNYPVVIGNDSLGKSYGLTAMPMTFLIDRKGRIAATSVGVIDQSACQREIIELLAK
ncbi:MAG TPA: TlpA disulfide reductase family protein [Candidatus Acidoferrales bacterium]|jgi:cytochrome c biogenesis protein CcmG/thiol:disulfide interchange protein DsbE|nr:TlpA disulfide reductase family protein [Candidatus Acidoferrales bacterium]